MTESEPKQPTPEKRNVLHNALVEVLDFVNRGRETLHKWQKDKENKRERQNDYCALIDQIWDKRITPEAKQERVDWYNKKYGTNHTIESFS